MDGAYAAATLSSRKREHLKRLVLRRNDKVGSSGAAAAAGPSDEKMKAAMAELGAAPMMEVSSRHTRPSIAMQW